MSIRRGVQRIKSPNLGLKYKSLVKAVGEITFEHFVSQDNIIWSGMVEEILGYTEGEMGHDLVSWESKVHPDDLAGANAEFERAAKENQLYDMEYRFRHRDGHYLWFNDRGSMHIDADGRPIYVIGVMKNITERKTAEESRDTLLTAVQQSSDWILITDKSGTIEYANDAVERITGYTREEILGNKPGILKSGRHADDFYKQMWDTILSGKTYTSILTNRKKNGELFEVYHTITPIKDNKGVITHFVATSKDITALKQMEEKINFLAYYDDLTGLPNKALFTERLRQATARTEYYKKNAGVLFIDIDRFHLINDTLGTYSGDVLLKEIAKRLLEFVRAGDTVSRFGSDEYAVALIDVSKAEDIIYVIEKLKKTLSEPIKTDGEETVLTFSIGISIYPDDTNDVTTLIQNADMASFQAKQQGGDSYRFFTSGMNAAAS
ncbi:MAG: diguanylate cyclase, partial [Dissulfurispiraceae bacterium]